VSTFIVERETEETEVGDMVKFTREAAEQNVAVVTGAERFRNSD
jgi:hypothetical protein